MHQEHDALHSLIHTLSESERKGFKKTLTTYDLKGRKNISLILYICLEKIPVYSYKTLVASTKGKIASTSLSSSKSLLKKKLLTYLRENDTHYFKGWHEMLENAHILCRRGIFDEARHILKKIKEEAAEANRMYYVIAALRIEGLIVQHLNEKDMASATVALGNEIVDTSKDLLLTSEIYNFYMSIAAITFKGNMAARDAVILTQLKTLSISELYGIPSDKLHPDQLFVLLVGKYNLARQLCKMKDLSTFAAQRFQLVKSHQNFFQKYQPHNIPGSYVDYIETCTLTGNESARDEALRELKTYLDIHFPGVAFYSAYYHYLQHSYIVHNETSHVKLSKAVQGLESYYTSTEHLPLILKKLFEMSILWCHYKLGDYDEALIYSRKITQENISEETADDIQDPIRIFTLAIQFEQLMANGFKQSEIPTFASFVTSEYHHFRKKKDLDYRLELALISLFRQGAKISNKQDLIPALENLRVTIHGWLDAEIPYIQTFNLGFKIMDWIDKQIEIIERI